MKKYLIFLKISNYNVIVLIYLLDLCMMRLNFINLYREYQLINNYNDQDKIIYFNLLIFTNKRTFSVI